MNSSMTYKLISTTLSLKDPLIDEHFVSINQSVVLPAI